MIFLASALPKDMVVSFLQRTPPNGLSKFLLPSSGISSGRLLLQRLEKTKEILSKQAVKIAKQAEEHERFITKVTHLCGVLGFSTFCFLLGASETTCILFVFRHVRSSLMDILSIHEMALLSSGEQFYVSSNLDLCYYANTIFLVMLLLFPRNEKFFMVCFSFAEGPLVWALIVWRCSLVFSSLDKLVGIRRDRKPAILANSSDADNVGSDDIVSFEGIEYREKISESDQSCELRQIAAHVDTFVKEEIRTRKRKYVAELEEKDSRNLHVPDASVNIDEGSSSQDVVKEPEVLDIQDKQKKEESPSIGELRDFGLNRTPEILPVVEPIQAPLSRPMVGHDSLEAWFLWNRLQLHIGPFLFGAYLRC
ncbi:hypothetical protein IFM89_016749 [Coptis chinensis]|uniref:Glycerophosphocholine acyltransferase 1 n=1 Tax=Coptis chinensis TaxID=261450 RepID=A0A835LHH5_9MAGN|nr:hypothetical protein IFM89_016749 [Coptis chinensis]